MRKTSYKDYATLKRGDIVEFDSGAEYTVVDSTELGGGCLVTFNQAKIFVTPSQEHFRPFEIKGYHNLQPMKRL